MPSNIAFWGLYPRPPHGSAHGPHLRRLSSDLAPHFHIPSFAFGKHGSSSMHFIPIKSIGNVRLMFS